MALQFKISFQIIFIFFLGSWIRANGHSSLTIPEPYTRKLCKEPDCPACPEFPSDRSLMSNDEDRPEVTWQRGQEVEVRWAKNNHDGGFVRLGIVPINRMFDFDAHDKFAIYYGCWEQGLQRCENVNGNCHFNCRNYDCAADKRNRVYSRKMVVPKTIPDGIYAFAQIWYGGIYYKRDHGQFSDYESCSFIKIEGGPLESSYQAFFEAGENKLFPETPAGKCLTSATRPIECKTGCDDVAAFHDIPEPFRSGRKPAPITPEMYGGSVSKTPEASIGTSPTPTSSASTIPIAASPSVTPSVSSSANPNSSPSSNPVQASVSASVSRSRDKICRGSICCPLECGRDCGRRSCWMNAAGPRNCCTGPIRYSRRKCGPDLPPCKMSRKKN